ncbi:hypothetical protein K466DRAFT_581544 [Polyporus arcularius HHB13444]|uniref:Secreted protein n=1 Tax=Polyporus arcularius HHB13444 TaxID=1314778 RepID=A0A5C3Q344_9APHY|nr:hypothetical protein K466DRAFT_581544 [Polyporus arcularius HHB13444]
MAGAARHATWRYAACLLTLRSSSYAVTRQSGGCTTYCCTSGRDLFARALRLRRSDAKPKHLRCAVASSTVE